jgi:RNA-directed DNA polymerase
MGAHHPIEDWAQVPWRTREQHVYRLQKRIYKAACRGHVTAMHSLQRLLMKSQAARTLAVRRVTQDNQGKATAGIDGIKSVSPAHRPLLVDRLRPPATIKAQPVRRVYIPKPGKKDEKRGLGIPVMLDRAHQALVKLTLEPEGEARFEANSYGFRPGRSAHDAKEAILRIIGQKSKYLLDADIRGCFDAIAHQALLDKRATYPALRQTIKGWLKAGGIADGALVPTPRGTPQGGVASPLLANVALHGLETAVKAATGAHLVRYADDLVCFHPTREGIEAARHVIEEQLAARGLALHPTKTRIAHTLDAIEGQAGCDFLGFSIRQYRCGRYRRGTNGHGTPLGFKTLIKPSSSSPVRRPSNALWTTSERSCDGIVQLPKRS